MGDAEWLIAKCRRAKGLAAFTKMLLAGHHFPSFVEYGGMVFHGQLLLVHRLSLATPFPQSL